MMTSYVHKVIFKVFEEDMDTRGNITHEVLIVAYSNEELNHQIKLIASDIDMCVFKIVSVHSSDDM